MEASRGCQEHARGWAKGVPERLLAQRVVGSRYAFLNLAPGRAERWTLALAGREECASDYLLERGTYPFHVVEYVVAGRGSVRLDRSERRTLEPGSVFAYGPRTRCRLEADPAVPMTKFFFAFAGAEAGRRLARAGLRAGTVRRLAVPAELAELAEEIVREGRRHRPRGAAICLKLAEVFLLRIEEGSAARRSREDGALSNFIRCKALIDAKAAEITTLSEVAAESGLDGSSICRLFRRFHGQSPYQYLLRRKMALAAEQLVESGGLVKEAALRVGFEDPYHFARRFRAVHGIAPSALKALGRGFSPAE